MVQIISKGLPQFFTIVMKGFLAVHDPGRGSTLVGLLPQLGFRLPRNLAEVVQHATGDDGLGGMMDTGVQILKNLPPPLQKRNGLHHHGPSLHKHSIEQVLRRGAHPTGGEGCEEKGQEREAPVADHVRPHVVAANANDLVPDDVAGGEAVVEEAVAEVGGVVGAAGGLDADVPEDLLVVGHHLEE